MSNQMEFLTSILGKTSGELSEAIKNDEGELKNPDEILTFFNDSLKPLVEDRIAKAKKEKHDEAYSRGKRETAEKFEKQIAEKYDIDDLSGGLEAVVQRAVDNSSQRDKLDPETIRSSDVYREDIDKLKGDRDKWKEKFSEYQSEVKQQQTESTIRKKAEQLLEESNFQVPENDKIRENLISLFVQQLVDGREFEIDEESGDPIPLKDGKRETDNLMNEKSFKDIGIELASGLFEKDESDDRNSPSPRTQGGGGKKFDRSKIKGLPKIESFKQFQKELRNIDDEEAREAYKQEYQRLSESGALNQTDS